MSYPGAINNLIDFFTLLPTVGPKTAERYVFYLLKKNPEELQRFAQAIAELKEKITTCTSCHAITENNPCKICSDMNRKPITICVVANNQDLSSIEATDQFQGKYHVLGGLIDASTNTEPKHLNIETLINKARDKEIQEIIFALAPTLEGETTAMYLAKVLKPLNTTISRLARGIPSGINLEYTDEMTLTNAIKFRNKL